MYAIIEDSGSQIKVAEGDTIKVDRRDLPDDAVSLEFEKVLMIGDGAASRIGQPYVNGAKVTADILEEGREDKIDVVKFKRRKGYKRRRGHRQAFIRVRVTGISS